jgi:Flp pilus assembly pilin Flp
MRPYRASPAETHRPSISMRKNTLAPTALISIPVRAQHGRGEVKRMTYLYSYFTRLLAAGRREEGQTMAEYGVILAVITVAIIAVLVLLSDGIRNNMQAVVDVLS